MNRAVLSVAVLLLVGTLATSASAQPAPGCVGRNLIEEFKASKPEIAAEIRRAADAAENGKNLLWKIEDANEEGRPPSYLFGTIHLTDDRVTKIPRRIQAAVMESRIVAIEIDDLTPERMTEAFNTLSDRGAVLLPASSRLDTLLSPPEAQRAAKALSRSGLPANAVVRARPWVASVMLATSDCERTRMMGGKRGLDGVLAAFAEDRGMGTVGLDTVELQFRSMSEIPDADQVGILKAQLFAQTRVNDVTETLIQLYLAKDIGAIWPLQIALAQQAGVDPKVFDSYRQLLLAERNTRMLGRVNSHLTRGGVFIAVGAMHLPGKDGVVAQLIADGFKLTPLD